MKKIMNLSELSKYLKVPKSALYKLSADGKIPSFKTGGGLRFRRASIGKWIERQETARRRFAMKNTTLAMLILMICATLTGCGETASGVKQDIDRMGKGINTFFFRQ